MTAFINTYVENSCALRGARRVKAYSKCQSTKRMELFKIYSCHIPKFGFVSKILLHEDQPVSLMIIPASPNERQISGDITGSFTPQITRVQDPK